MKKGMFFVNAIRYYSRTGNTEKMAKLLGEQLNLTPETIDKPLEGVVDKLFIGGGIYNTNVDKNLREFTTNLDPTKVKEVVLFGTSGSVFTVGKQLGKILKKNGIPESNEHLYLHGLMPKLGNFNEHQKKEIQEFADKADKESLKS